MSEGARRTWTITKFGRHTDGYLHARVTVNATTIYVHHKSGSWMAPGESGGKAVLKEVLKPVAEALQAKGREFAAKEREQLVKNMLRTGYTQLQVVDMLVKDKHMTADGANALATRCSMTLQTTTQDKEPTQ